GPRDDDVERSRPRFGIAVRFPGNLECFPKMLAGDVPHSEKTMSHPMQPLELPAPTIVRQSRDITCWAACLRSINQTNRSSVNNSEAEWSRLFREFVNPNGINLPGFQTSNHVLGMFNRITSGQHLSFQRIRDGLTNGYVMLGFIFPHPPNTPPVGHAVVVYGVDSHGVRVMNPDAQGPNYLTAAFLRSCRRVIVGVNILPSAPTVGPFAGMWRGPVH